MNTGLTLDKWALQVWDLVVLDQRTLRDYQGKYGKHISPKLGHLCIEDLARQDVQRWVLGLTPTQGRANLPIVQMLIREAITYNLITLNPTREVKKKRHVPERRPFLKLEELTAVDFGSDRRRDQYLFLARHGLRWSEYRGLRPEAICDGKVHIARTDHASTTKGGRARVVPFVGPDPFPVYGDYHKSLDVFKAKTGGYLMHSARKTYAFWVKKRGVHVQVAQKLLGHSSIVLTMDLYTDVDPEEIDAAGVALLEE